MSGQELYGIGVTFLFGASLLLFPLLLRVPAPYGRHQRSGWGPDFDAKLAWMLMESPSVVVFAAVFCAGEQARAPVPLLLLGLWQAHYLQRSFVFPWLMRGVGKRKPVVTLALSVLFNLLNASLNAFAVSHLGAYPEGFASDPRFLSGVALFGLGMAINLRADAALRRLRAPGESGYRIPRGGLFEWVTSPNYLGEVIEWCGWALASGSLAGAAFALFTFANLAPRAVAHRRWYRERFPDYPRERRAILPGIL